MVVLFLDGLKIIIELSYYLNTVKKTKREVHRRRKEILGILPEPYRSKALANYIEDNDGNTEYHKLCDILREALVSAFLWKDSPEGFDYWEELFDNCHLYEKQWRREKILKLL